MKLSILLILFLFPFSNSENAHEFHISKCEVDYNVSEKALQITMHVFLDDLELSMENQGMAKQFLCTEKEREEAETAFFQYLKSNFKIELNNQETEIEWIGKEVSEDLLAMWCYFEIPVKEKISSFHIENSIIMDIHEDQKNIIQIKGGGKSGYFMLQKGKESKTIAF